MDSFRIFLEREETAAGERAGRIKSLLDSGEFVLLFKKKGVVYGAPEESRIALAQMLNPTKEEKEDVKEINFMAINLDNLVTGHGTQVVIGYDDVKDIRIIDSDKAAAMLTKKMEKEKE